MKALTKIAEGSGGLAVRDTDPRPPSASEVLVKISMAGVCGTDVQICKWTPWMQCRMKLPRTIGHEAVGIVEAVGPDVSPVKPGSRISFESHTWCGYCHQCRNGRQHVCRSTG